MTVCPPSQEEIFALSLADFVIPLLSNVPMSITAGGQKSNNKGFPSIRTIVPLGDVISNDRHASVLHG